MLKELEEGSSVGNDDVDGSDSEGALLSRPCDIRAVARFADERSGRMLGSSVNARI